MDALRAGLELTVAGMGLVFLLLAILWASIALLVRTDHTAAAPSPPAGEGGADEQGLTPALLAAVPVAVRLHRHVQRRRAAPAMRAHRPGTLPSRWLMAGRTRQNRSWAPRGRFT